MEWLARFGTVSLGRSSQSVVQGRTKMCARVKAEPLYLQVANVLRARIVDTLVDVPVRLPNEVGLVRTHGVSRFTIRKALEVLVSEGLIDRAPKRGTITNPKGIRKWKQLRRTRAISVIMHYDYLAEMPPTFFGQIYQGILSASGSQDYRVRNVRASGVFPVLDTSYRPEDPEITLGVITAGIRDDRFYEMHAEAGYPVVSIDHWAGDPRVDSVVANCFAEATMVIDFLVQKGHRELFYVGNLVRRPDGLEPETDALIMEAGFRRAVLSAGLERSGASITFCHPTDTPIASTVDWFTRLSPRPTAGLVFDASTLDALIEALGERDIQCPRDVSLMCKSHSADSSDIACVRTDGFKLGEMAVKLLLGRASDVTRQGQVVAVASALTSGWSVRSLNGSD